MFLRFVLRWLVCVSLLCPTPLHALWRTDSLTFQHTAAKRNFTIGQLIAPSILITTGSMGWLYHDVSNDLKNTLDSWRDGNYFHADDYLQYANLALNLSLGTIGVKARNSFTDRMLVTITSGLTAFISVTAIKKHTREKRPDSNALNSFPSGHTATAFLGAELIRHEYGWAYGIGAYAVASGIAFLRLYNNRHWLNDVLAGAGFGILCANVGYWLLPLNRRIFRLNKVQNSPFTISPYFEQTTQAAGFSLMANF